jgi:hypothetical protein
MAPNQRPGEQHEHQSTIRRTLRTDKGKNTQPSDTQKKEHNVAARVRENLQQTL